MAIGPACPGQKTAGYRGARRLRWAGSARRDLLRGTFTAPAQAVMVTLHYTSDPVSSFEARAPLLGWNGYRHARLLTPDGRVLSPSAVLV